MSQVGLRAYWLPSLSKHARTLPSLPLLATSLHLSSPSGPAQGKVLGFTGVLGLWLYHQYQVGSTMAIVPLSPKYIYP